MRRSVHPGKLNQCRGEKAGVWRKMPGEVSIHVDVDATGRYAFRLRSGTREITTSVNPDLAASFYEDLRLLRWKSAGVHDPGDTLLNHVGERLAGLIAPPATWEELGLPTDARHVRVQFSQAAHRLMPFPWELLHVNDQFLIGVRGSHLVRMLPAPAGTSRRRNHVTDVVHVSLGTDAALRFDEERCTLLETIPANIPIEFLIDPSVGHIEAAMDGFRPHIVIVSGHGHYDDLRGEHYLSAGNQRYLRTARLVERCASYGCKLLVLSTCESARLGGPVIDDGTILPADLIAFSFPVRTTTATQSLARLFHELVRGQALVDAMAAVRAIDTVDEYAFFNAVHLHRGRARPLHIKGAAPPPLGPPATRCPGMELDLGMLNGFAHCQEPATLLAPVGGGGEALVQHWAELVRRSQSQATRWRVLADGAPILDVDGAQLVRLAYPYSFVPVPTENLVYCDGMDRQLANTLLAAKDKDLARQVAKHPLLGMPGFVNDLIAGRTEQEAVEHFEQENKMAERAGQLTREGRLFASWLFAIKGVARTTLENRVAFAEGMKDFGVAAPVIVAGIENALAATVSWYGEHGRLEDMKATIELLLPHANGMPRIILRGHLASMATHRGDYRTGLTENQQLETDLQDLRRDDDYYLNLQATITHQIDCLRELGRLDEAEQRLRDAHDLLPRLTENRAEAEARLLGQLAHLRREQHAMDAALDAASQAVQLAAANDCPAVLIAELRHTRADLLRQLGRDREAIEELNATADTPMSPALRSRLLHLKALLLEGHGAPQALEHLLESYEQDRLRGDNGGVAISLLEIARIFTEQHEYDRARERIREALPLADACGLANVVASLALLWADIDLAEGKTSSAATWLITARNKFTEGGDEGGAAHVTRLLDTLRARTD
jgi:tetratricopeptide (TPR) repeat protein